MNTYDQFFQRYKELPLKNTTRKKKTEHRRRNSVVMVTLLIQLMLIVVQMTINDGEIINTIISVLLLACATVIMTNFDTKTPTKTTDDMSFERLLQVKELLLDYSIDAGDTSCLKRMIEYTQLLADRRNPFTDLKKVVVVTNSILALIIAYMASALNGEIGFFDGIPIIISVALIVFAVALAHIPVFIGLGRLLYPDLRIYKQLIDDLQCLAIFGPHVEKVSRIEENDGHLDSVLAEEKA